MKKKIIVFFCLTVPLFNLLGAPPDTDESGKILADWIKVHLDMVRTTRGVQHVAFSRHFAYTSIAFYEAILPGYEKYNSLGDQLRDLGKMPVFSSGNFVKSASANASYAKMLGYFYLQNSNFSSVDSAYTANRKALRLAGIAEENIVASENFGKAVADVIIRWAEKDGSLTNSAAITVKSNEGGWETTPPRFLPPAVPLWKNNRAIVLQNIQSFISKTPPVFSTDPDSPYQQMVREVFDVSQKLSNEEKNIALFWDDSPDKFLSVFGHWSSILCQVIRSNQITLMKGSATYVNMMISMHDASLVAWYGKYTFLTARPITNIRRTIDAKWSPLIETPPHPEFPAAHATFSGAACRALSLSLGTISFTDATYKKWGMEPRTFKSFKDAATEAGMSRLYGGIHYRFSIDEGFKIGSSVAETVLSRIKLMKEE